MQDPRFLAIDGKFERGILSASSFRKQVKQLAGLEHLSDADLPESIASIATSGTAMVSFIENRGNRYIALVNQSYTQAITVQVTFNAPAYTIERDGSFVEHGRGTDDFTVDPGDLMVIKVK